MGIVQPRIKIEGTTINNWRVISFIDSEKKVSYYLCECLLCNTEHKVNGKNIRKGRSKQCFDCSKKIVGKLKIGKHRTDEVKQKLSKAHTGKKLSEDHKQKLRGFKICQNDPFYLSLDTTPAPNFKGTRISYVAGYKFDKVKRQKYGHDLTKYDVAVLITKPCKYCGTVPDLSNPLDTSPYHGIDRVDSSRGYFKDNVVPCCKNCNFAKNNMTVKEFISWIERVSKHQKGRET